MKKIFLSLFAAACAMTAFAMEGTTASGDTTGVMTLEQIIAQESKSKYVNDYTESLRSVWGKNTFLNLIYNTSHKMSSEEFPATAGMFYHEYEPKWGVGLKWGHTFNFHKKPIGSVLFIGLDYVWMDLKFNMFEALDPTAIPVQYDPGVDVYNMPWHNEKMMLGYGMTLGPSLTFYPFTPLHKSGANKVRLQLYYHFGYGIEGALIKKAIEDGGKIKDGYAYGHGMYTSFGFNLSWDFVGIGYEIRNDNKLKFKATDKNYDTGKMTVKEKTGRLYLQLRF